MSHARVTAADGSHWGTVTDSGMVLMSMTELLKYRDIERADMARQVQAEADRRIEELSLACNTYLNTTANLSAVIAKRDAEVRKEIAHDIRTRAMQDANDDYRETIRDLEREIDEQADRANEAEAQVHGESIWIRPHGAYAGQPYIVPYIAARMEQDRLGLRGITDGWPQELR